MKKLLSLEDLYNFYVNQNKNVKFSSKKENHTIFVHINEPFEFEASEDDELNLYTNLRLCHLDKNVNGSSISREVMENAMPTAYNMPILGYIWHDEEDGLDKFASHEFYVEDGEIIYEEIPVGCIPESADLKLVENKNGKTYLEGKGLIWRTYTKAAEILEREKNLSVSVELAVSELSFNAKSKIMNIEDFKFTGITILQAHRDDGSEVKPGMEGAEITIGDFSESVFAQDKVIEMLEEINQKLSNFAIDNSEGKEEDQVEENVIETNEEIVEEEVQVEESAEEEVVTEEAESTEDTPSEEETVEEEKFSKTFELSHSDIRCGLYALLEPFEETDNEWYLISDVYDDHFVYEGFFNSENIYDQKYIREGDNIAFEGDRIHMNRELLTDNELAELNAMRSNYAEIQNKLQKYEDEPKKQEVLTSESYSKIAENDEFKTLVENHFDLSVEELTGKCDQILLNAAKAGTINFEAKPQKPNYMALPTGKDAKVGRYGSLFKK